MLFVDFKTNMFDLACFNTRQIKAWKPDFDNENLVRWNKSGYIIKLKNGFYTFPEYYKTPGFNEYIANRIYKPSYISLHYALKHYGLIPEEIFTITSVSSLKTISFSNSFGNFTYQKIKPELMFGYENRIFLENRTICFAHLEKAILDLFYLFPFYATSQDITDLRFDHSVLQARLNMNILFSYLERFKNKSLEKRIRIMINTYGL